MCTVIPSGSDGKESACSAGGLGLIPGLGRSPGGGHGNSFQCSCLETPMNRGAWQATIHGVARVRHNLTTKPPPTHVKGLLWWLRGKESACNTGDTGDMGLIPGSGRSTGDGNGNPLPYSCLGNPMDRGAWQATGRGVARVRHNLVTKLPPPPRT